MKNNNCSPPIVDGMQQYHQSRNQSESCKFNFVTSPTKNAHNVHNPGNSSISSNNSHQQSNNSAPSVHCSCAKELPQAGQTINHPISKSPFFTLQHEVKPEPTNIFENVFSHSPTSQSLNLSFSNQSNEDSSSKLVFKSNNPFLNESFDASEVSAANGSNFVENFFRMDDEEQFDGKMAFLSKTSASRQIITTAKSQEESSHLKNKREQFSNASMKICLVVSPPTNKFFQVRRRNFCLHGICSFSEILIL